MSKSQQILSHLKAQGHINHFQALKLYKTTALGQHITYLKRQGWKIKSIKVKRKASQVGRAAVWYQLISKRRH